MHTKRAHTRDIGHLGSELRAVHEDVLRVFLSTFSALELSSHSVRMPQRVQATR